MGLVFSWATGLLNWSIFWHKNLVTLEMSDSWIYEVDDQDDF
jgi:hypothetical protein